MKWNQLIGEVLIIFICKKSIKFYNKKANELIIEN